MPLHIYVDRCISCSTGAAVWRTGEEHGSDAKYAATSQRVRSQQHDEGNVEGNDEGKILSISDQGSFYIAQYPVRHFPTISRNLMFCSIHTDMY